MGTNYDYHYNICPHCKRYDKIHIGKQSYGWSFGFRGYPKGWQEGDAVDTYLEIHSFGDWKNFFAKHPGEIIDEDNKEMNIEDFISMVDRTSSKKKHAQEHPSKHDKMSEDGYSFTYEEFS